MKNFNSISISNLLRMLVLSLFITGFIPSVSGQNCDSPPDCIINGDLNSTGTGDLETAATVNGWFRSHGTPTVSGVGAPGGGNRSIWMWSYSGNGEGIYSCFNFQSGRNYQICLWVRNTNGITGGNLNIKATTGLSYSGWINVPTPATSQLISNSFTHNSNWVKLIYSFTPNANYNQLWIYPFRAAGPSGGQQYELRVDLISVIERPAGESLLIPCGGNIELPGSGLGCVDYRWYAPNGNYLGVGPITIPNADPSMSGTYTLRAASLDCEVATEYQVDVEECPPCEVQADFNWEGCNPVNFTETSSGTGTAVGWYWDFGDGSTSNQQNPSHGYAHGGVYTVCLTVIRRSGNNTCCDRICKEVDVCDPRDGFHAPENDASAPEPRYQRTTDIEFNEVKVSPNPAGEYATVTIQNLEVTKVSLRDMRGTEVAIGQIMEKNNYRINMQGLASGVYIVAVDSPKGQRTLKLVKK